MMSYVVAWFILASASIVLAWLVWRSLRRFRLLAGLVASLIVVWSLTPIELNGGEYAPAFIALLFRLLLEQEADATTPVTVLFFPTLIAFVVFFGLYVRRQIRSGSSRARPSKSNKEKG